MELKAGRRAPLFLFLSRVLKIDAFSRHEWQHSEHELCARRELLIVDLWSHEFTRMNLSAPPISAAPLSMSRCQIFGVGLLLSKWPELV
jgi:hypothetical protein